jgi:hypothetical protein
VSANPMRDPIDVAAIPRARSIAPHRARSGVARIEGTTIGLRAGREVRGSTRRSQAGRVDAADARPRRGGTRAPLRRGPERTSRT